MNEKGIRRIKRKLNVIVPMDADYDKILFKWRWPKGFICPQCGSDRVPSKQRKGKIYQCLDCKYQASPTAGTVFHKTRTPMHIWCRIIYIFVKAKRNRSIDAIKITDITKIVGYKNYKSIYYICDKIRSSINDPDSDIDISWFADYFDKSRSENELKANNTSAGDIFYYA